MSRLRSLLFVTALTASCAAEVVVSNDGSMVLRSGAVEYRLQARDKTVYLASFGPAGRPLWKLTDKQASDIAGRVEGQSVTPADLLLVSHEVRPAAPPAQELGLVLRHADWCLQYDGKPILKGVRAMLDFAKPQVRQWARGWRPSNDRTESAV
jgi:hypothetical protein